MAKRLTEDDIRRIFRDKIERDRGEQDRKASYDPETFKVWGKIAKNPAKFGPELVQEVIDAYWEVVEEDLNAHH